MNKIQSKQAHPSIDPVGPHQWMVRWEDPEDFSTLLPLLEDQLQTTPPRNLIEPIFGYQSLLLIFNTPVPKKVVTEWLSSIRQGRAGETKTSPPTKVKVSYDGPDLKRLAKEKGCSIEEIINRHCQPIYTVHCLGFSPGFPYLGPLEPFLWTPRKNNPRKHIRPGAVAIGGSHTGIYSIASPGGWHWIGNTRLELFNRDRASEPHPDSENVFTFKPGDRLQFIPIPQ